MRTTQHESKGQLFYGVLFICVASLWSLVLVPYVLCKKYVLRLELSKDEHLVLEVGLPLYPYVSIVAACSVALWLYFF
jgi:hypothetical protein